MNGPLGVLADVARRLESVGIDYFLVGSLAAMYYARPRFTNDVDLVVQIKPTQIKEFHQLFDIEEYYCPPIEIVVDEVMRGGSFNLIHQESGVKVDVMALKQTEYHASEFVRRRSAEILPGVEVMIAAPENVILKKLDFYREGGSEKHLLDVREVLAHAEVDRGYLSEWVVQLGLERQWAKVE